MIKIECGCCDNGYIRQFSHVEGGECFACEGKGYVMSDQDETTAHGTRVKNLLSAMSNLIARMDALTGYEEFYDSAIRSMGAELAKFEGSLSKIEALTSPDFINDMKINTGFLEAA